jgi:phosphoenolpyruvate---glycerone phosphotransferase subunit DhaM
MIADPSSATATTLTHSTMSNMIRKVAESSRERGGEMVGVVVVSHSPEIARGVVDMAGQMAGQDVRLHSAGGDSHGTLGTDEARVRDAIRRADQGDGVVVLADLGSAVLTIRHILECGDGVGKLADAPVVEGAVAAAVVAAMGLPLDDVVNAAEEARHARKL